MLRSLGLYESVLATGARQIDGVTYQLPGASPRVTVPFPTPPEGGPPHGLGVRRTTFDALLVNAVRREVNVTVREAERVTGLIRGADRGVSGVMTTAGEIRGRIVIAADGLHSAIRAWVGLRSAPCANALRPRRPLAAAER